MDEMKNPEPAVPDHYARSGQRRHHWAVTCANDDVYEHLLIPFLGSLISVAKWEGSIAVFDYGLSKARVARLRDFGIAVEPVQKRHAVTIDRFLHLRAFAVRHDGIIGQWDSDVWFPAPIFELFDTYDQIHRGRLLCEDARLSGEDVLPGFECRVAELFAEGRLLEPPQLIWIIGNVRLRQYRQENVVFLLSIILRDDKCDILVRNIDAGSVVFD